MSLIRRLQEGCCSSLCSALLLVTFSNEVKTAGLLATDYRDSAREPCGGMALGSHWGSHWGHQIVPDDSLSASLRTRSPPAYTTLITGYSGVSFSISFSINFSRYPNIWELLKDTEAWSLHGGDLRNTQKHMQRVNSFKCCDYTKEIKIACFQINCI